jgi:hypothetical protein
MRSVAFAILALVASMEANCDRARPNYSAVCTIVTFLLFSAALVCAIMGW